MMFRSTPLAGAYLIELDKKVDDRGFFSRVFCQLEFGKRDLIGQFRQVNSSFSPRKGTLRGMHYQLPPRAETKIVRCTRGSLFDAILDLRQDSPTFGHSFSAELNAENRLMMYVPKGFAHGFLTLADDTEATYFVDEFYAPEYERCIRYDDPKFRLPWPGQPTVISVKDKTQPDFNAAWHLTP